MSFKFDHIEWNLCTKNSEGSAKFIYLCGILNNHITVVGNQMGGQGVSHFDSMDEFMKEFSPYEAEPSYTESRVKSYYRTLFHNEASFQHYWRDNKCL